jgi:ABC-type phosphate/phosphonate transport system substrate-binding protein
MHAEGKIQLQDFNIINKMEHPGMKELCSTDLYPEWPIAALADTQPAVRARMKHALMNIPEDHPALKTAQLKRFVEPMNYEPLEKLLQFLRAAPFDRGSATLRQGSGAVADLSR